MSKKNCTVSLKLNVFETCALFLETGDMDAASAAAPPPGLPLTDKALDAAAAATSAVAVEANPAPMAPVPKKHRVLSHIGMQIVFNPTAFSKTNNVRSVTDISLMCYSYWCRSETL